MQKQAMVEKILEENQRKIEEAQKKLVSFDFKVVKTSLSENITYFNG